jgi:UDP-N-acetylmuramoyl-L-alanyl-D-glutamate--2,6-diaminopimelate ligase
MPKKLQDILYKAGITAIRGKTDREIVSLHLDSREVKADSLFAAAPGSRVDGHRFIGAAEKQGATAVLCETLPESLNDEVTYIQVRDVRKSLGIIADNYYDHPSEQIRLVGITGTNGKTTTASLLYRAFMRMGYPTGLISTISNFILDKEIPATHTTPDVISLHRLLAEMKHQACTYAFMEVSSHAVDQQRIAGVYFNGGVFTNLTHDHLDYHKTFKAYLQAKKAFFDQLSRDAFALINADDKNGLVMLQNTQARIRTYSLRKGAFYKGKILEKSFAGMQLQLYGKEVWTPLVGQFNAYNLLAVCAVCLELGMDLEEVLPTLSTLGPAEGRFEYVRDAQNRTAIIDYAHSPDALKNVLETINDIRDGNKNLITVVGAGGDRDKSKRPLMASIAVSLSNRVILTSDNPRSEEAGKILSDMLEGVQPHHKKKVLVIEDRKEAIRTACVLAEPGDVLLIAGKGHEKYQEIMGVKHPFDDKEVVAEALRETE